MAKDPAEKTREEREKIRRYWDSLERQNEFQILGVSEDADPERIKLAYYALAKRWHTDTFAGLELGEERDTLDAILKRINEAYENLTDPKKRAELNVYVDRKRKGLSTDVNAVLQAESLFDQALAKMRKRDWTGAREDLEAVRSSTPTTR
jgi:curved DNA-binding protein CbpA